MENWARKSPDGAVKFLNDLPFRESTPAGTGDGERFPNAIQALADEDRYVRLPARVDEIELLADPLTVPKAWRDVRLIDAEARAEGLPTSGYLSNSVDPPERFAETFKALAHARIDMVATLRKEVADARAHRDAIHAARKQQQQDQEKAKAAAVKEERARYAKDLEDYNAYVAETRTRERKYDGVSEAPAFVLTFDAWRAAKYRP